MKAARLILLWLYCLAYMVFAAPCRLAWDPTPNATSYAVFRGIDQLAEVTTNEASVELPADQLSTLVVIARNASGSSAPSEHLTVQPVEIQTSRDLLTWTPRPVFFVKASPAFFLRAKFIR